MKADRLRLALRPRPMQEAADLGVRLAQSARGSLVRAYLPLALALVFACGCTFEVAEWLPCLLLWWGKPWLDRVLLHVYARQVFGEPTDFRSAWEARRQASWTQLFSLLTRGRLWLSRAYVLPVYLLEGSSGAARRARLKTLLQERHGAAVVTQMSFSFIETSLVFGLLSITFWIEPRAEMFDLMRKVFDVPLTAAILGYLTYAAAVVFLEPFHAAAGFAMYLNRRVELEAWDVEQELRNAFGPA
jgi:hypothetical protein